MNSFTPDMKMSSLVGENYRLLSVILRLGIDASFGEKTVQEVCQGSLLDTDTFLLLCEVYTRDDYVPDGKMLRNGHIDDVLRYIHRSHDYYLQTSLVSISEALHTLIAPCSDAMKKVIWKFFDDYKTELENHFAYEETLVIPYIQNLLIGKATPSYSIRTFEDNHSNIDDKLSDLKNLVMKSLPEECDATQKTTLLIYLFTLQEDLDRHTRIENNVMVPMVKLIENPSGEYDPSAAPRGTEGDGEAKDDDREALSDREKEILVSVAMGLLNKEIADKHSISINTVITHRKNITRKIGIKTVAGLTVYAILNGLVNINDIAV